MRQCTICKQLKGLDRFSPSGKYLESRCKDCRAKAARDKREYKPKYGLTTKNKKEYWHARCIKDNYNLTPQDYNKMLQEQQGVCRICQTKDPNKNLCVDHDHATGKVRSLLCDTCNILVGIIENKNRSMGLSISVEQLIANAITYLYDMK